MSDIPYNDPRRHIDYDAHVSPYDEWLEVRIERGTPSDTLYVAHHFMCLRSGGAAHFFYTPRRYWCTLPWAEVPPHVRAAMPEQCAVFEGIQEQLAAKSGGGFERYDGPDEYPGRGDELIGNHYCVHGSHVYTYEGWLSYESPYAGRVDYGSKPVRLLTIGELEWLLSMSVRTRTPAVVKEVGSLYSEVPT